MDFFLKNGFSKSIEEIADGLHITTRTIFNRYKTIANIETEVLDIWREEIERRLNDKFEYCNHGIEKLLFIIFELKRCHQKENEFFKRVFQRDIKGCRFLDTIVYNIIISEYRRGYFNEFIDKKSYIPFFLHNVIYYLTENPAIDVIVFALYPILSERGCELLRDIDIDILLE
ncbi:hypothetical protein LJC68_09110 [Bacteroidales bacterium OttesenSCG-928-B11]|nr:hypothetical protein [Bacteroidales bacterium OttesenSCG-928-B11]